MLAACGGDALVSEPAPDDPPISRPPISLRAISLPGDDAAHDVATEWWYFNGHLADESGPFAAFHYVVFKVKAPELEGAGPMGPMGLMGHLSVTDLETGEHRYEERLSLAGPAPGQGFSVALGDWSMSGLDGLFELVAGLDDARFDLRLTGTKAPVAHPGAQGGPDGDGLVFYSPDDVSYYYSYPRLDIAGTLTREGETVPVSGTGWMDHQWGDFVIDPSGWDWFSVQLDDGTELMLATIRADGTVATVPGTFVDADGIASRVAAQVTADGEWRSEATGGVYPIGWTVVVPDVGLSLRLDPVALDAEIDPTPDNVPTYWEGPLTVSGTRDGEPISGIAFAELVGYAPSD